MNETELKADLESKHDEVLTTSEMQEKYSVMGFCYNMCVVKRKIDSVVGSLDFSHSPRFYFGFVED